MDGLRMEGLKPFETADMVRHIAFQVADKGAAADEALDKQRRWMIRPGGGLNCNLLEAEPRFKEVRGS